MLYGIDRNSEGTIDEGVIAVRKPNENFYDVDAIVITAIHYYNDIEKILKEHTNAEIVSLDDVVYSIGYENY